MGASHKPPSLPDSTTHWRRVCMAQHSPQTHLSIAHHSDLQVSTDQGRLFLLHLPLRNDPRLTGQGKLPVPPRSSLVLWSIPALLRTAYWESAQGRNGRFLSRHFCYICCSRLTQRNLIAPQWRRIAICEESRTNTQSQVSLSCSHKRFWVQEKEAFAGHRVCDLSRSRHASARRCVPAWYARRWSLVTAISRSSLRPFLFAFSSAISPTFLFRKGWSVDKKWFLAGVLNEGERGKLQLFTCYRGVGRKCTHVRKNDGYGCGF